MAKFKKKPVVIEACQNNDPFEVIDWASNFDDEIRWRVLGGKEQLAIIIPTLEGEMRAERGDWIIRGVQGEFYPCKPDIFSETYEPAKVSASNSTDLLSAVSLTRIQETKLRYLVENGGSHSAVTVHVGMPDGRLAEVDPFGRVTWRKKFLGCSKLEQ